MAGMIIQPFETEQFFARYEFNTPYQLCNSDCESMSVTDLLDLAGEKIDALGAERLIYTESQGRLPLREAIAGLYEGTGPEAVVMLGTPVEGIYLAARALLEPSDEVVVLTPAYDALINLFEHIVGADRVRRWRVRPGDGEWTLDLDELDQLLTPKTRLLVVNFPHNPTGYLPDAAFQRELIERASANGTRLFCDEMYHGLVNPGRDAIASAADTEPGSVVLSGLSKTYGLPGLRSGWLMVQDRELRDTIMNWKYYTSICPPTTTEFLSLAALKAADALRRRSLGIIATNLEKADAFFARWPNLFTWRRPAAGSTALVEFHVPSVEALSRKYAKQHGVLIQSGRMLGSDDRHMRIGLGRADFGTALAQFENCLERDFPRP